MYCIKTGYDLRSSAGKIQEEEWKGMPCNHSIISTRNYKPVGTYHYLTNLVFIRIYVYLAANVSLIYLTYMIQSFRNSKFCTSDY
jgi:hypothetical protein